MVERKEKYYLSCPCCNKLLFRYEGSFSIEVKCSKCNRDIVVLVHGKETNILKIADMAFQVKELRLRKQRS